MNKTTNAARTEAIVRAGVHIVHEFSGGVVALYSTSAPAGFAVDIRRNLKKTLSTKYPYFATAYAAFLAVTEAEIVRQGGKLEEIE